MNSVAAPLNQSLNPFKQHNRARQVVDDFGAVMEVGLIEAQRFRRTAHVYTIIIDAIKACSRVRTSMDNIVILFNVNPECEDYSEFFDPRPQDKAYGKDIVGRRWNEFLAVINYVNNRDTERYSVLSHFDCIISVEKAIERPRWHAAYQDTELDMDILKSPTMFVDKLMEVGLSGLVNIVTSGGKIDNLGDIVKHVGGIEKIADVMSTYADSSAAERNKYEAIINNLAPLLNSIMANESAKNVIKDAGITGFQTAVGDALDVFTSEDFPDNGIKGTET